MEHAPGAARTELTVNGEPVALDAAPATPLLLALRNDLGLKGVRPGCAVGECGACTVLMDGAATRSCLTPVEVAAGTDVTTPEGLGTPDDPHPIQQAFIDEQAAQCGYCINGMIMQSAAFLEQNKKPTEAEIKEALARNLCRCGTHARIVKAVKRASSYA